MEFCNSFVQASEHLKTCTTDDMINLELKTHLSDEAISNVVELFDSLLGEYDVSDFISQDKNILNLPSLFHTSFFLQNKELLSFLVEALNLLCKYDDQRLVAIEGLIKTEWLGDLRFVNTAAKMWLKIFGHNLLKENVDSSCYSSIKMLSLLQDSEEHEANERVVYLSEKYTPDDIYSHLLPYFVTLFSKLGYSFFKKHRLIKWVRFSYICTLKVAIDDYDVKMKQLYINRCLTRFTSIETLKLVISKIETLDYDYLVFLAKNGEWELIKWIKKNDYVIKCWETPKRLDGVWKRLIHEFGEIAVDTTTKENYTDLAVLRWLKKHDCSLNNSCYEKIAVKGCLQTLISFLEIFKPSQTNVFKHSLMIGVMRSGKLELVQWLIENGYCEKPFAAQMAYNYGRKDIYDMVK